MSETFFMFKIWEFGSHYHKMMNEAESNPFFGGHLENKTNITKCIVKPKQIGQE